MSVSQSIKFKLCCKFLTTMTKEINLSIIIIFIDIIKYAFVGTSIDAGGVCTARSTNSCVSQQQNLVSSWHIFIDWTRFLLWTGTSAHNCCRNNWFAEIRRSVAGLLLCRGRRRDFAKCVALHQRRGRTLISFLKYPWGWGGETRESNFAVLLPAAAHRGVAKVESAVAHTHLLLARWTKNLYSCAGQRGNVNERRKNVIAWQRTTPARYETGLWGLLCPKWKSSDLDFTRHLISIFLIILTRRFFSRPKLFVIFSTKTLILGVNSRWENHMVALINLKIWYIWN